MRELLQLSVIKLLKNAAAAIASVTRRHAPMIRPFEAERYFDDFRSTFYFSRAAPFIRAR